jgi:hypothetical protein
MATTGASCFEQLAEAPGHRTGYGGGVESEVFMKKIALSLVLTCAGAMALTANPLTLVSVPTYHYDN